jgi:hypothetical protein
MVTTASVAAAALTVHTAVNIRLLRRPIGSTPVPERVSVLLPVRDERDAIGACLASVLASVDVPDLEILILDDGSQDGTAEAARAAAGGDERVRILTGTPLPAGWLGKPHACDQLARAATGTVLVFLDADVRLAATGLADSVRLLRGNNLQVVCPYPRQLAESPAERLIQPLLQWSWLTLLPLRLAEQSPRPSLTAANGQVLATDAAAYRRAGGHAAIRDEVLEDIALVRAIKRAGGSGGVADGTTIATTRMYTDWQELRDGYGKSLWAAGGSPAGSAAQVGLLGYLYVLPAVAALRRDRHGLAGYAAGVAGRVISARATGGRSWPDAAAHPVSIALLGVLTARSWWGRRQGTLTWKGRTIHTERNTL